MRTFFRLSIFIAVAFFSSHLMGEASFVSFDASMRRNYNMKEKYYKKNPTWHFYKALYQTYTLCPHTSTTYLIPQKIHFIWLGSPLPDSCKKMIDTWKKFHPAPLWEVKVWQDSDVAAFKLQNQLAFERAKNYGEKSDIFRYEILYRFGGLYVDTDFECLAPFDSLHQNTEFFAGLGYTKDPLLYNGLIGTKACHPILKLCMDTIVPGKGDHSAKRIMKATGPWHFTRCFQSLAGQFHGKAVPFPLTYFYAFPNNQRFEMTHPEIIKKTYLQPESMALHYWATSWWKGEK